MGSGADMLINPLKAMRHRRRVLREAQDEAMFLRRRFGAQATDAACEKLRRTDLTTWGREVVGEALKMLKAGEA